MFCATAVLLKIGDVLKADDSVVSESGELQEQGADVMVGVVGP